MSVIIDQFEVIVDAQQGLEAENQGNEEEGAVMSSSLKPQDISAVLEQQYARNERVRAH